MEGFVLDQGALTAFLLALVRTGTWAATAPIIGTKGVASATGRAALGIALALFLAPLLADGDLPESLWDLAFAALVNAGIGLGLGWVTALVVSAFVAAGTLIDFMSGFSAAAVIDPGTSNIVSVFARFSELVFGVLLFISPAHRILVAGFVGSFDAVGLTGTIPIDGSFATAAATAVGVLLMAAIQIGAPVLGALFLTEVALALAARFVPQANVFLVGLPLKAMVALLTLGTALVFFPAYLDRLVEQGVSLSDRLLG